MYGVLGLSENDVRLELAREEAAEQECGVLPINNVSPSAFILAGLDLEEQQYVMSIESPVSTNVIAGVASESPPRSTRTMPPASNRLS
jgi:hypothetical protein